MPVMSSDVLYLGTRVRSLRNSGLFGTIVKINPKTYGVIWDHIWRYGVIRKYCVSAKRYTKFRVVPRDDPFEIRLRTARVQTALDRWSETSDDRSTRPGGREDEL